MTPEEELFLSRKHERDAIIHRANLKKIEAFAERVLAEGDALMARLRESDRRRAAARGRPAARQTAREFQRLGLDYDRFQRGARCYLTRDIRPER